MTGTLPPGMTTLCTLWSRINLCPSKLCLTIHHPQPWRPLGYLLMSTVNNAPSQAKRRQTEVMPVRRPSHLSRSAAIPMDCHHRPSAPAWQVLEAVHAMKMMASLGGKGSLQLSLKWVHGMRAVARSRLPARNLVMLLQPAFLVWTMPLGMTHPRQ